MSARFFKKKICSKNGSERSAVQYIIEISKIPSFINPIFILLSYIQKLNLKKHRIEHKIMDFHMRFC